VDIIFYDGSCGLCHGTVKFAVRRDRLGLFRFAPLGGETFLDRVPPARRSGLPDSIVVLTESGGLLTRSAGVLHILRRLGGIWNVLAAGAGVAPRGLRDAVYDFVARIRYRVFRRPQGVCPLLPPDFRGRFLP
jgi:predicted DCC family thiol-disulfide oxidoreductase YuxK